MIMQSDNYQQELYHPFESPNHEFGDVYSPTSTVSSSMPETFANVVSTKLMSDDTNNNAITKSSDREVVLFPTYAMRKPDGNKIILSINEIKKKSVICYLLTPLHTFFILFLYPMTINIVYFI